MNTLTELYAYRQMIYSLVKRDLRGRYKGSALGFLWTFINPLLQLVVYTIVFSVIMKTGIDKFYLFLFVALVPWLFFSTCLTGGASCIMAQQDMVKKIYFPREVLPLSYVISQFINMLLTFLIIFLVIIMSGTGINLEAVLYLPLIMIVEMILALGITMLVSALTVYFRDLEYILGIAGMIWMYLTPIMYSVDQVPKNIMPIFNLNPMTPLVIAYRDILYYKRVPEIETLGHALLLGIGILFFGCCVFNKLKRHFAEEL
ncbi:ABC-2 type transport system permease protein [Anaerocolumna jejuensis DSM 15929]|uniref:Transport permease protein n=1 Tax=Anaerocolumna jejuensis DSM 15929 TaxID=1121322 RepID=A0A1M6UG37_9FIRM|nr:ABC transporter permease [Anaerocolumna jejuensis]SHK68147.1 ABC-2 type transport system permease protein [Anaerocolumna jejuensis DSM 15929]